MIYHRLPQQPRGYLAGTLTLFIVLLGTIAVVNKYRDTKTSTVIGSATMDMSTQAAPGTTAVVTETVHAAPFQASASYTGSVVPDVEEEVYPRVTGRLVSMPFYPGDRLAPRDRWWRSLTPANSPQKKRRRSMAAWAPRKGSRRRKPISPPRAPAMPEILAGGGAGAGATGRGTIRGTRGGKCGEGGAERGE